VKATAAARAGAAAGYASLATEALAGVRTLYALNLHGPTRDRFGKVENRNGEGERERERERGRGRESREQRAEKMRERGRERKRQPVGHTH